MKQEEVLGALIGLTGAISNNGKTADTDRIVAGALTGDDYEKSIRELHEEKNRIAPDCATCKTPCGSTADCDMRHFWECEEPVKRHKQEILEQLREIAVDYLSRMNRATEDSGLPDACYRAIGSLGWPMDESACQKVLLELQSDGE